MKPKRKIKLSNWDHLEFEVLRRNNYQCSICKDPNRLPIVFRTGESFSPNHLVALCRNCFIKEGYLGPGTKGSIAVHPNSSTCIEKPLSVGRNLNIPLPGGDVADSESTIGTQAAGVTFLPAGKQYRDTR